MEIFDEKIIQALGFYVYVLVDPDNNTPFYIGKGTSNRIFDHLKCSVKNDHPNNLKYNKIRAIHEKDQKIKHYIVRHGLTVSIRQSTSKLCKFVQV